ncbi:Isoflavone-7-O-beta-glucoside 6''-O-malonyltransferase [Bertholletia excelsa]
MAQSNTVELVELCRVAPPSDSAAEACIPLTFFDIFWLKFPPTQRIFFYQSSHLISDTNFSDTVLPKLKQSLSVTLRHYLPLCGNLTWPQDSTNGPVLQYTQGDAISLTVAEADFDFHHLSGDDFRDPGEFRPLLPDLPAQENRISAMALQITLFPSAGFTVGYTAYHWALNGKSIAMFMHSWASICRSGEDSGLLPELTPVYDRTCIKDPLDLKATYLKFWSDLPKSVEAKIGVSAGDAMMGTFRLSKENIESMKKKYDHQVTSFMVVTAYTWVCLVRARGLSEKRTHFVFSVDCRSRMEHPICSTYFGNCLAVCFVAADSKVLIGEEGVGMAVKAIGEALGRLKEGVLRGAEAWLSYGSSLSVQRERVFSLAGSPRFELYNVDFGWGRPTKVEVVSIAKSGAFSLSDSRDGSGGVEIGVVLKNSEIEAFSSLFADGLSKF